MWQDQVGLQKIEAESLDRPVKVRFLFVHHAWNEFGIRYPSSAKFALPRTCQHTGPEGVNFSSPTEGVMILRPLKEPLYNSEKKIAGESSGVSWYQGKGGVWIVEERNGFEMSRTFFPSAPNKNWTRGRKFEAEVESYRYFTELPFWKRPEKEPQILIQKGEAYPGESAY